MPGLKHIIQQHPLIVGTTTVIISVVVLGLTWFSTGQNQEGSANNSAASDRYAVQSVDLPVASLSPSELSSVQSLSINGQLNVNNSLVLSPSSRPASPVRGQLYYDGASNTISYFDGTVFTSVADSVGQSVQDSRIDQVEQEVGTLRATAPTLPGDIALLGANNTFSGTNLFDGSITANGLYVSAAAQVAQNLLVGGSTTISQSLAVNGATTLGATSISSLVLSTTLPVSSGGTGTNSFVANGVVIGNGTDALGTVSAAASDLCLISTAGAPEFKPCPGGVGSGVNSLNGLYGSLTLANATAAGSTVTIDNASTSAKGLAQFNASNFSVIGGVVNTVQNLSTSAAPTFSSLTVSSNLAVSGSVTIGIVCTPGQILTTNGSGTVVCVSDDTGTDTNTTYVAGNGITITGAANTISINPQTGGGLSFTGGQLGLIGCTAGQILKYTGTAWGCAADSDTISPGDGIGVTALGTLDSQTKNSNGASVYNNGGTITIALQSADASNPGLITTGAQTFSGAKVFSDDLSLQGDIGQAGSGTFTTGTGAVTLNGNVTIASGRSLTLGTSCTANQVLTTNGSGVITCVTDDTGTDTDTNTTYAAGNGISISGASNTIAVNPQVGGGLSFSSGQLGLIACTAGQILKYSGTAWGCAADSDTVSAGDGIGTTAVGTLDSQVKNSNGATIYDNGGTLTIALQTADETAAGLVSTGLQTFSGAKTFTSPLTVQNNFVQSGAATFTTGTGAVALNGDVTIASGSSLTLGAVCVSGQVLSTNESGAVVCVTDDIGTDTDTDTTYAAGDGITISGAANTISVNPQTGGGLEFNSGQLSLLACSAGQILKYSGSAWGCAADSDTVSPGDGIGVTAVGALDGQTKNANGATIYDNGGILTVALQSADALNSGLLTAGSQTIGGAKTFVADLSLQGNFGQSGSGSFSTGTGVVSLNGSVVIASGRSLTLGAVCTAGQVLGTDSSGVVTCVTDDTGTDTDTNTTYAAGDGITISGPTNAIAVNPQTGGGLSFVSGQLGITACSDGEILKYTGDAWGCAADSDTVSPGDGIGVTAVGTLDSQTKSSNGATIYNNGGTLTIALQSADGVSAGIITAGAQTIGGAKTFADALTVQGAFTQTGSGTFSTGTGSVLLNGAVTIAAGQDLTLGAACTAGQVLTTDSSGTITCITDDTGTDTDTNTTYAAGDGIAITGASNDISVRLQTGGGLSFVSGQIGLLDSCTVNQVLKFDGGSWVCADDVDTDTNTGVVVAAGSGTNGRVAKFNASGELADSGLSESGTTGSYTGNFIINGQTGFTGNLLDVQLNGVSRLSVTESGETTISGGLAVSSASGVTVGVAGSVQGSLKLATTGAGTLTLQSQPQAGNVTLSVPAITGNDTICLQTLANCGGEAGGVTTIGVLDSQTKGANGATIVGTTLYLQTADTTSAGIISTGAQTIAGNKTFKSVANSQTAFRIQNATNDTIFTADTSANVITAGQANTATDSFTKLADPSTLPPNSAQAVSYSNNGRYLVAAHQSSPYVTAYVRSGNSLTALSSSAFDTLPSGTVYSIAFTQDDQYLALGAYSATSGTNNLYVYKVQGDTFTKIADPTSLPAGNNVQGLSWSPDGAYLAVGTNSSDFLMVYKRSGDTLSALTVASQPSTPVRSAKFSPDGAYLAVGHNTSPYITMYKRSGDTFTPLASPFSVGATGQVWGVDFSRDGTYFAAAHATFPYLSIYKRSGDTFTKLSNPSTLPSSQGNAVHFSASGSYLAVAHNNSPYLSIYKRSGDTFTKLTNPSTLPAGNGSGAAFSPDGRYLSVASASSPYITTYDLTNGKNVDVKVNGTVTSERTNTTSLYVGSDTNLQGKVTVGATAQFNGATTFSNTTTVAADFSIQNSAASTNILYANSSANTITIGQGYTDTLSLVSGVTALSGGSGTDTALSRTGNYLAAINTSSPYIHTYKYNANGTFTKLANPDVIPGVSTGVALSSDATYMVVTQSAATRFAVYKRSGDSFTKLTNPTQPSGNAYAAAFSKDDTYLAIAHTSSPYVSIYKRSGDTFTKLSDPADLPTGQGNSVAFSDNGEYLIVGHNSAPYITIYKRSGDTFTKLANPSTLPTSSVNGVAFSPDSGYMAVAYNSSPYVLIYKRSGDTFTKLADPSTLPASNANGVAFSADGTFLTVAHDSSPYITTYKRSGDTFTKLTNPSTLPAGSANGVAYSGDGRYMSVSHGSGSLLTVYRLGKVDVATNIYGSLGVAGNAAITNLTVSGISTFQDTISGTDAAFGAGVTIGTLGSSAGELTIASADAGSVTLTSASQTGDYTLTIPTLAADDTFCLQSLGNCTAEGGVGTSGSVTAGALTKFDGSGNITSSGLTESGTTLNYGGNVVANVDSGFSGNVLDLQKAGSSLFKVSSGGLVTTAGGISGVSATADNTAGSDLAIRAGNGTGSGGSGAITFSTAAAGGSSAVYKNLSGMLYFPNNGPPMTHSYTVTSGTNQVLLIAINSSKDITSVTYAGQSLTLLYQYTPESHISYWYLTNPPVGTGNIVSQFTDGFASATTRAMVLENVNQTTPFGTPCTDGGYVPTTSCTLSTDPTDIVYTIVSSRLADPEAGSGQTSIFEDTNGGGAYASMSYKPASGSSTIVSYTTSSGTQQGILAVAAKSADVPEAGGANQMEERLRITNEGNIGIGTINPQYLLDVNGDINTSAGILTGGVTRIDASGQADFSALNVSGATTLGVLGSSAGQLSLASAGAGTVTVTTASQTGDYTITIPALSANDTVCLQTLANCGSGDAMTVGTIDGQTKSADGAVISGSSIYLQTADATHPGLVSTGAQTIAGVKTFSDTVNLVKSLNVAGGVNVSGYATSETSNTYTGQYTKIANCTITDAYKVCRSQAVAVGTRDGATNPGRATIDWRVQQNALGSEPLVNVEITDTNGNVDANDFVAVSNVTGSQSSVDLYFKIDDNYRQYAISPLVNVQYGDTWNYQATTWLSTQGFVASVPSGTQTTGVDARIVAATLTTKGTATLQGNLTGTTASFTGKVNLGTAGTTAGQLGLASTGAGSVTLTTAAQTANRTITIPAVTGDDTVCLQNLGNCAGGSGGVGTSGTVTAGALTKFDGSGGITSSALTESGTTLNYSGNVVANVDSGFSGNILNLQKAGSSVLRVGSGGLLTTAGGISGVAATGTNATGGNLTLQAGSGTGSAGSGVISFSTASQAQDPFVKDLTPSGQFYQSSSAAASASFSQTVTSGSNQVLLVTMATGHGGVSATSVTYGGVALTKLAGVRQTFDASYTEMWYLVNPNVGSATVNISLSTSATLYARAMVLTGVNQTTPFNTACSATASTTSITCSADTSGAGVVVSLLRASATYSSMGSSQVSVYGNETPPAYTSVSVKPTTTSSTSMSYTLSSGTYWGFLAVGVRLADTGVNPMGLTLVDTGTLEGGPLTERMRIASDGKVGIGTFNPQYQLDVAGDINTSTGFRVGGAAGVSLTCSGATQTLGNVTVTGGIITAASCATNNSDLAENYASQDDLSAGEIVMTSGVATSVNRAASDQRDSLLGVVSTAPGLLIGTEQVPDGYPIALSGRVPVKVNNKNGPIAVGDKITISSVAGVGMKATSAGMIVGTALEAFNGEEGTVEVFVNASYWAPSASETLQGTDNGFASLNVSGEATVGSLTVGTVTVTGDLTVHGALTVASIVVNGHIITASGKPTIETQPALNGGTVIVDGTDTIGTITITTGATPTAGELAKLVFSETYTKAPRVILSPSNEAAADFAYYKGAVSLENFMLNAKNTPAANTTYVFDYFIAE